MPVTGYSDIDSAMIAAGNGARGIVHGYTIDRVTGYAGHVFNVKIAAEQLARMPAMTRDEATHVAQAFLDETSSAGREQAIGDPAEAVDIGWAWLLPWNSRRFYRTRNPADADKFAAGPLVVTKDTRHIWPAGYLAPVESQLAAYAKRHGYTHTVHYKEPRS